ncbi:GntR family transcriptional regulator [Kocuria palustris]|nr:GntR family transcriptional regulator [Kocuria palustris]MBN6757050.1 GntR family transcriptional regulator [Kocuria palustris]MBN6762078.1 GntR family transcriptional regulator [Kocuria palustris]MBN6781560.1 GntR family transcriptional regulator [Kocuria palustris]MBN6798044.1 GntR family transcriptional regulator [Kocuria palustris]
MAAALRSQILEGALQPGERVIEPELAQRFGASKTPVREALQLLVAEGLVEVLPKKGYRIRGMELTDLGEVLELRTLLEPRAAARCARWADPEQVEDLTRRWEAQRDAPGLEPLERTLRARDFHAGIAQAAGSHRMSVILEGLHHEMVRAHHVLPQLRWHLSEEIELREHRGILAAITAGDPERAEAAMRTHMDSIRESLGAGLGEPGTSAG